MKKIIAGIVFVTLAVAGMPVANADAEGFLIEIQQRLGKPAINTSTMLLRGHQICNAMDDGLTSQQVANNFYQNTDSSVSSQWEAEEWVIAASDQLCPWQGVYRKDVTYDA